MTLINKVVTNSMSEIYGKMNASGNVVLVNPNGILLANGSEINAGGFAAYAAAGTKLTDPANRLSEGKIIADGKITVGVGTAKAMAVKFGVENFAVGLGEASGFGNANKIALVANGDVTVNKNAKLTAVDTTVSTGSSNQGAEGFNMGGVASSVTGTVYIRPDANDNDYGQVYLNGSKLFTANEVDVYYNAKVKGTATTDDGVLYNKKDYANDGGMKWANLNDNVTTINKTTATLNTDAGTVSYLSKDGTAGAGAEVVGYALVHNMAQLQDIDTTIGTKTNADGKLDGTYALGKDLYAQKDTLGNDYSYVLTNDSIIFTTTDGAKMTAVSGKDSGIFNSATQKTLRNGAVLKYTAGNVTSDYGGTTYTFNGTTIKDSSGATYTVGTDENGYTAAKGGVAITDTNLIAVLSGLQIARTEFSAGSANLTNYLGKDAATVGKEFAHMNTSTWNNNQGFDPIGNAATPFTGTIFGIGGDVIHIGDGLSEVHTIYDLPINMPTTDNVGLVGVGSGATIDYVQEANTSITGHSNVGGMMGKALNGSTITDSANIGNGIKGTTTIADNSGYVRTTSTDDVSNIGGLVGDLENSHIVESANSATIIGQVDSITDLNVKNVGGLAGTANNSTITRSVNQGNVFGEEKTGGIVGNASSTRIGTASLNDPTESISNNGQITGTKDTGGIAGYGSDIHMYGVYNTNEDSALSGNSQYIIDPTGKIIGRNPTFVMRKGNKYDADGHLTDYSTSLAGNGIYSDAALSVYGKITGTTNTGGLVGEMESTSTIDTAYNAGNVTGTTDTGGLIGRLNATQDATYTTNIKNAYNGDNNTVIREDLGTIPSAVTSIKNQTFDPGNGTSNAYSYNPADANYYSFYTQDANGAKTYFYFVPAGGKTEAGAGGVFVKADGTFVKTDDLPASNTRIYTNRVGYKDANVNGTTNTGGLIGEMNSGVVTTTYDTGTVNKGVAGATTGALVGTKSGGTLSTSFFVTGTDKSAGTTSAGTAKPYSGQTNAVGTGTADANVAGNTLAYWRNSTNIKALSNDGSFIGDAAAVDSKTGYQKFTGTTAGQVPKTYYWTTKGDVYYYTDDAAKTGKTIVMTYNKVTGQYDGVNGVKYTLDKTVTKAIKENEDSQAGSATYIYTDVKFDPVGGGTSLTMHYATHASNETTDNTWIEYPDETTPLLQHFMFPNNIARHLTYDAKTHNFKTDDVNNVYGRADFTDGVSGKNVNTNNQAQSADPEHQGESEYFYNSAAIWSPQHGYKINANVSVTITSGTLDVNIQGTRVYGDAGNTTGYYIVVPYQLPLYDDNGFEIKDADGNIKYGEQQWAYYTVNDGSGNAPYTLMTDADWNYGGKDYRSSTTTPKPEDLLALCNAKATYMATYKGVAGLEANQLNTAVQTVIRALKVNSVDPRVDNAITYTSGGNGLKQIETASKKATTTTPAPYPLGDQSLEVGTYNVVGVNYDATTGMITNQDAANIGGIENINNNYKVTYSGGLTVNKADLYYTYDGEKVYGDANGSGANKYTLVGKDGDSTTTSVNGYLKSFDSGKLTTDANGVITAGANVTTNGLVGDGSFVMSGTPQANTNITDNGEQSITQGPSGNAYYQVMVDPADGTLKTYKVTKFANGTMSISAANTSAEAAAYINKNYNMVWKSDTTEAAAKARTTVTSTGVAGAATVINSGDGTGYHAAGTDVGAHASSELITPAELKVTVAGQRTYGDLMDKTTYTTDLTTLTSQKFNVTGAGTGTASSGLKAGDTMGSIIDTTKMTGIVAAVEGDYSAGATKINDHTHVGTYGLINGTDNNSTAYPDSRVDVETTTGTGTYKHYDVLGANNYNYIVKNGAHQEAIVKRDVTVTTEANREYGTAPDATGVGTNTTVTSFTQSGLASFEADRFNNNHDTWITKLNDYSNIADHVLADGYGTLGSTDTTKNTYKTSGAVTFNDADKATIGGVLKAGFDDYNIKYDDKLTINKAKLTVTVTGERYYGDNMNAAGDYTTSSGTIPDITTLTKGIYNVDVAGVKDVNGDTAANILNTANMKTRLGTVDNGVGDDTTVGSKTHIGTYTATTGPVGSTARFTLDNVNTDPKETSTNAILSSGDYYVDANGANTLKIVKRPLTLTTTGGKVYDTTSTDPTAVSAYDINTTATGDNWNKGIVSGDEGLINKTTWIGLINHKNTATDVGTYGTNGTQNKDGYLTYTDSNKATIESALSDYDVHYADTYTITGAPVTIYIEGNRTYGDANTTTVKTSFTQTGILAADATGTAAWTNNKDAWEAAYTDITDQATHAGAYGTEGPDANAYKTSGAITLADKTDLENKLHNYTITYTDKLTVKQAPLNITVTGERQYGDKMDATTYTTTSGTTPTLTEKIYNVDVQGIKNVNNDSITTVLDATGMKSKLAEMDAGDGNNTDTIGRLTNVGTYTDGTTIPFGMNAKTKSTINATTLLPETNAVLTTAGNGDYYVANENTVNQLDIIKRNVTADQTATKLYGTGAEHTTYDALTYTNVLAEDSAAFAGAEKITNNSNRATPVGTYTNNLMTIDFTSNPTIAQNYNITTTATLNVKPDDFTYTADQTSYWQYQHIPAQTGKVTNSYGEDVSDLAGIVTWPTPADGKVVGFFPIWGRGTNDASGNYRPIQAATNPTALEVKKVPKNEQTDSVLNENLLGAWQSFRRPLLDIMYLKIKDTGFKSWDNGVFVTANPYVPAGDKTNYGMITFNGQVLK
jgi:hypothetical protein